MAEIVIQERQPLSMALVNVWPDQHQSLRAMLHNGPAFDLPEKPGVAAVKNHNTAFWIGPDSYFLVSGDSELVNLLRAAVDLETAVVSDLSHARAVVRITGADVRQVLAKGLPVDLHPREFPAHSAAVSAIHGFDVLIHLVGEPRDNVFDLYAARSYAADFRHWLSDASLEFG